MAWLEKDVKTLIMEVQQIVVDEEESLIQDRRVIYSMEAILRTLE